MNDCFAIVYDFLLSLIGFGQKFCFYDKQFTCFSLAENGNIEADDEYD
jgi:hypothetical protein